MKPKKQDIKKWVRALRSGKYKQTKKTLQNDYGMCCLGVLCKLTIPDNRLSFGRNELMLGDMPEAQPFAPGWVLNMANDSLDLAGLNDQGAIAEYEDLSDEQLEPFTFDEIADMLELKFIHEVEGL